MAVQDNGTRIQYTATASQTVFPYPFEILDEDDITVVQNSTTLSKTTHYTVSDVGSDTGGNITFVSGATSGDVITIYRSMALSRLTNYQANAAFLESEVDADFDRLWMAMQQNESDATRGIRASQTDSILNSTNTELANPATRAGKVLGFDSTGALSYYASTVASADFIQVTTTAAMAALASPTVGDAVETKEFSTGNGGGGTYDCVTVGTTVGVDKPNTRNIIVSTSDATKCFVQRPPVGNYDFTVTTQVPGDFLTLQEAVDFYKGATCSDNNEIIINIESGHALTSGVGVFNGDCSHIKITSSDYEDFTATASQTVFNLAKAYVIGNHEIRVTINGVNTYAFTETSTTSITLNSGATSGDSVRVYYAVKLDAGFVGVDTTGVPLGVLGESPRAPLFLGYKSKMPFLSCVIDMGGNFGTGMQLAESEATVDEGCGVVNAGFRGTQVHGRLNAYLGNFSGAEGTGIRLQQASSANARAALVDDCCKSEDLTLSAIYISRSSTFEFRGGSAQNSGASGLIARRSIVTADDANFDGAGSLGISAESSSKVSFASGSAQNTVSNSLRANANATLYAVGATTSTTSSADNIDVDVGGVVTVAGSNTVEGVANTEAQTIAESNVAYVNSFDGDNGMVFYDGGNGTFKITSNSDGISQRFADGRMITYVAVTVNTGTVSSGSFSTQLTMPTQPDTFITVDSSHMDLIGRTAIDGGGSRVCVDNYYRPAVMTGSAWRIYNTGQELDGAGTGFNCLSLNITLTTFGTWK